MLSSYCANNEAKVAEHHWRRGRPTLRRELKSRGSRRQHSVKLLAAGLTFPLQLFVRTTPFDAAVICWMEFSPLLAGTREHC